MDGPENALFNVGIRALELPQQDLDLLPLALPHAVAGRVTGLREPAGALEEAQVVIVLPGDNGVLMDAIQRPDQLHAGKVFAVELGRHGLGCAEEQDCVADIDFLCGTFGKALASVGGYIVCSKTIRDYLVNKMRTFIFTTALPPVNLLWTFFILEHLNSFSFRRERLKKISSLLKDALVKKGYACPSTSHILPMTIGDSGDTVLKADFLQRKGFYALPVRPPTVPEGTSRIRFSLTADITEEEIKSLIELI